MENEFNNNKELKKIDDFLQMESFGLYTYNLLKDEKSFTAAENIKIFEIMENQTKEEKKQSIDSLMKGNAKLVISIARKYSSYMTSFELQDLCQEGFIGLYIAIQKYDYKLGYAFSTYATNWIKQTINRAIENKDKTIRLPSWINRDLIKMLKEIKDFTTKYNREPTNEELSKITGFDEEKINTLKRIDLTTLSLDMNISPDKNDECFLVDMIEDKTINNPEDIIINKNKSEEIIKFLKKYLTAKELDVISKRFGLINDEPITLKEIGNEYGVSRERIRQIEKQALEKLEIHKDKIKDFYK